MSLDDGRTACLPWYDLAEVRGANDALWSAIRARLACAGLEGLPPRLCHGESYRAHWTSPEFILGQACGYDVLISSRDDLVVVASPHYEADGCEGALHRSYVIVRDDAPWQGIKDLRGARCAYNNATSHSGRNALRALVAPHHQGGRFFGSISESGSHEASLDRIRRNEADVASIDCVTWGLIGRHRPAWQEGVRVLAETALVTAPPLVANRATPAAELEALRAAIVEVMHDPLLEDVREQLLLVDVSLLDVDAYGSIAELERSAEELGYKELRCGRPPAAPS